MMRDGRVYGLPMQVHHTTDSESSLLRTPVADETGGAMTSPAMAKAKGQTLRLSGQIVDMVEPDRLPKPLLATPNTMDSLPPRFGDAYERVKNAGGRKNRQSSGNLREQVVHVLPTPKLPTPLTGDAKASRNSTANRSEPDKAHAGNTLTDIFVPNPKTPVLLSTPTTQDSSGKCRDHGGDLLHDVQCGCSRAERRLPTPKALDGVKGNLKTSKERIDAGHYVDLPNVANDLAGGTNWGQYAPAIERWESVIGRPAPAPTKPDGRDGSHRLSSAFTEWMMGLPEGWVTGCGLSRNEELKACGNGVVPQQAVLALSILLEGVEL
jgi:hypothetical protein